MGDFFFFFFFFLKEILLSLKGSDVCDDYEFVIYYDDEGVNEEEILNKVTNSFGMKLDQNELGFVRLSHVSYSEPLYYPVMTMLGQSLGSMLLALEALLASRPDVMLDTAGFYFFFIFLFIFVLFLSSRSSFFISCIFSLWR